VTFWTFLIGTIAIAGIPPLAGFFSKDAILAAAFDYHPALFAVGLFTAGLTACYMFRAVYLTFFGSFRGTHEQEHHLHESPAVMTVPLMILAVGAIGAGFLGKIPFLHADWFGGLLAPVIAQLPGHEGHAGHHGFGLEVALVGASVAAALLGWWLARRNYGGDQGLAGGEAWATKHPGVHRTLEGKYFVDELYDRAVVRPLAWLSKMCWKVIDELLIDGAIHVGAFVTELTGDLGRLTTTGNVRNYALFFFAGVILLFAWLVL
jgi:NADH-quinone oxidoreductase subunit L